MADYHFLLVGIVLAIICCIYLTISKRQRRALLTNLNWRGRRDSSANTPPRSLSPEKKVPNNSPAQGDYITTFPPCRREAIASLVGTLPVEDDLKLVGYELDESIWTKTLLPFASDYMQCSDGKYTPTGISVGQIKALGDFPDYAELSGVPLPQPYHDFDINKAISRPYRPFRWAYHQTMCKLPRLSRSVRKRR